MTHGLLTYGDAFAATNARVQIGDTLTLPAGGPWTIYKVHGLIINTEDAIVQPVMGELHAEPPEGDLEPDPSPARYPLFGPGDPNTSWGEKPLIVNSMYDAQWLAFGKAQVDMYYLNRSLSIMNQCALMGILFDKSAPIQQPTIHSATVGAQMTAVGEQDIGTVTLSQKAERITSLSVNLLLLNSVPREHALVGSIRLDTDDFDIAPAQFPCRQAYGGNNGTAAGQSPTILPPPIPVNIPVIGGARINVIGNVHVADDPADIYIQVGIGYA